MLILLLVAVVGAHAADPSALQSKPESALVDEIIALRPAEGRHFNVEAPQKCGSEKPLEALPRRIRCQFRRPGKTSVLVSVCDDGGTLCRQERFDIDIRGVAKDSGLKSPMAALPRASRKAPEGFLDNVPAEALTRARKDHALILIDFYGIWCPPCNALEERAYPTAAFQSAAAPFVRVGLDVDARTSFEWKERFHVGGYPTLIVADENLKEIGRLVGYRSGAALASFLKECQARRNEPVEAAEKIAIAQGEKASEELRLRVAQWRTERGEFDAAERFLVGLRSDVALKTLFEGHSERARLHEDVAAHKAALTELTNRFPNDVAYTDWASTLADLDAPAAHPLEPSVRRSVERWLDDPSLEQTGYDPGDLLSNLASFLESVGSTEAAKAVWSRVADAYAAEAAGSPLATPRAANIERADALRRAGRSAEAKSLLEVLVRAYPDEFTFNNEYAQVLSELGDNAAALPFALRAAETAYGDNWLRAIRLQASIELKLGRAAEAAKTIDEALVQTAPPKSSAVRSFRYFEALRTLRRKIADELRKS